MVCVQIDVKFDACDHYQENGLRLIGVVIASYE